MSDEAKAGAGKKVSLVSQEGDAYEVEIEVCKMSELVKTMLPDGACVAALGLVGCFVGNKRGVSMGGWMSAVVVWVTMSVKQGRSVWVVVCGSKQGRSLWVVVCVLVSCVVRVCESCECGWMGVCGVVVGKDVDQGFGFQWGFMHVVLLCCVVLCPVLAPFHLT